MPPFGLAIIVGAGPNTVRSQNITFRAVLISQ
jgi:hypothetical protein